MLLSLRPMSKRGVQTSMRLDSVGLDPPRAHVHFDPLRGRRRWRGHEESAPELRWRDAGCLLASRIIRMVTCFDALPSVPSCWGPGPGSHLHQLLPGRLFRGDSLALSKRYERFYTLDVDRILS